MIWVLRFEILQVVSLHGLDICMVSCALCLCMANEDIDALLEEFRSTGGVLKQQERHDDVGCHLVQTACEEGCGCPYPKPQGLTSRYSLS